MKKNYFWGVFLILAGAYLVVSQMGYLPRVGLFTLVFTIVCLAVLIASIPKMTFGGILFPLAFIGILYDEQLGITAITPWTILLAALLGTIGLHLLFDCFRKKRHYFGYGRNRGADKAGAHNENFVTESEESVDGEYIYIHSSFGSVIRYVTSTDFQTADIDVSFGAVSVYFDNAAILSGNAVVNVDSRFAGVELYVPQTWQVINHVKSSFGGIEEKNKKNGEVTATLTLEGSNSFAGITIYYV